MSAKQQAKQPKELQKVRTSTKSTKQSNLADWGVCSSAASKNQGGDKLVGQKRPTCNGKVEESNQLEPEKKKQVSEFTIKN